MEATCADCGGPEGESKAWHESVLELGDLDLIEYRGEAWHRKCAKDDGLKRAESAGIKRLKRGWGR